MSVLPITLFADFACPFSYLVEVGLERVADERAFRVNRAYELFPEGSELPEPGSVPEGWEEARALAATLGILLRPPSVWPRTTKAHEAARFAAEHGVEAEFRRAVYAAVWEESVDIGRIDVLASLLAEAGTDAEEAKIALDIDRFALEVASDLELARRLGVRQTPILFLGRGTSARAVIGAHPVDALGRFLAEALAGV
jgi:predicted DsbA family dithiol-disulfide isomerase